MANGKYLPRRWERSFKEFASASSAVRNMSLLYDPRYIGVYTHFLGDALPGEWVAAKTNGTSAATTVATSQLTLTAGTDNDGYAGQGFGLFWKGDNGIYMESEQSLDTLTTAKIEIGLSDAHDDAGAVNVKATPTATATDFAVLVFDTDDNTALDLISQKASGVAANTEGILTLVGGTDFTSEFVVQNDLVSAFVNGSHVDSLGTATGTAATIEGGTLVTPWWFCQTRAVSASRIMTVNWAICVGRGDD